MYNKVQKVIDLNRDIGTPRITPEESEHRRQTILQYCDAFIPVLEPDFADEFSSARQNRPIGTQVNMCTNLAGHIMKKRSRSPLKKRRSPLSGTYKRSRERSLFRKQSSPYSYSSKPRRRSLFRSPFSRSPFSRSPFSRSPFSRSPFSRKPKPYEFI
jgi:hypothetical protein